jgi:hypothetical protein
MGRACFPAVVAACAALVAAGAVAKEAQPLLPTGGIWQSIPYSAETSEPSESTAVPIRPPKPVATTSAPTSGIKPRLATKAAAPATAPKPRAPRHPVAAAAVSEEAPHGTAAARTKELERRLDVLMPGTRLGEAMADRENPAWRRARPGRPTGEANSLSVPFDDKGQAGFIARGYHADPDVQNPNGNTGATFGLRTRF